MEANNNNFFYEFSPPAPRTPIFLSSSKKSVSFDEDYGYGSFSPPISNKEPKAKRKDIDTYEAAQEKVKTLRTNQQFDNFQKALPPSVNLEDGVYFHTNYITPIDCMDARLHYGKFIASGSYGRVYEATDKDMGKYVVKVARLDKGGFGPAGFQQEVEINKTMGELGIGPKVYNSWTCKNGKYIPTPKPPKLALNGVPIEEPQPPKPEHLSEVGFMVSERLDTTLWKYRSTNKRYEDNLGKIESILTAKLEKFYRANYYDTDRHMNNIMLKLDENDDVVDVFFIDFGLTEPPNKKYKFLQFKDDVIKEWSKEAAKGILQGGQRAVGVWRGHMV